MDINVNIQKAIYLLSCCLCIRISSSIALQGRFSLPPPLHDLLVVTTTIVFYNFWTVISACNHPFLFCSVSTCQFHQTLYSEYGSVLAITVQVISSSLLPRASQDFSNTSVSQFPVLVIVVVAIIITIVVSPTRTWSIYLWPLLTKKSDSSSPCSQTENSFSGVGPWQPLPHPWLNEIN